MLRPKILVKPVELHYTTIPVKKPEVTEQQLLCFQFKTLELGWFLGKSLMVELFCFKGLALELLETNEPKC